MMKRLLLIASLGMNLAVLAGQVLQKTGIFNMTVTSSGTLPPEANTYIDGIATMYYTLPDRKINGSPYLNEEFLFGVMNTVDTVTIEGLRYRYDVYHDEMQFILRNDTASIIRPLTLISLEIGSVKFVYDVYLDSRGKAAAGYFEILTEGKLTALLRRTKELEYDEYVKNYGGGGGSKEFYFKDKKQLYIRYENALARKIANNRNFMALLKEHRDEIRDFMKSNRLSPRREKDLERIVSYYNELETD
jgi:hypothetical protein